MNAMIQVEHLSKRYRIVFGRPEVLKKMSGTNFPEPDRHSREPEIEGAFIWALRNISFSVEKGQTIGIIGKNGSGKSTLLKILSRITEPSAGRAILSGRVSSLLEVGAGYHRDLTGRENIYLSGAVLGMKRREIERRLDEIVAFAEIEAFLDTPVKYYSSGMYSRLGFAVASHLESEILLVDEALAVGDVFFREKCLGTMGRAAREGRTILFVSHNLQAVQSLCEQAILLEKGQILEVGETQWVISKYLNPGGNLSLDRFWKYPLGAPGNSDVRLRRARVVPEGGDDPAQMSTATPFRLEFEFWNLKPETVLSLTVHLCRGDGVLAVTTMNVTDPNWSGRPLPKGLFRSACFIPGDLLNDGVYVVGLQFIKNASILLLRVPHVLKFNVADGVRAGGEWLGRFQCAVRPKLKWTTDLVTEETEIGMNQEAANFSVDTPSFSPISTKQEMDSG